MYRFLKGTKEGSQQVARIISDLIKKKKTRQEKKP